MNEKTADLLVFKDIDEKINICVLPPKERRDTPEAIHMVAEAIRSNHVLDFLEDEEYNEEGVTFEDIAKEILETGTLNPDYDYDVYIKTLPTI